MHEFIGLQKKWSISKSSNGSDFEMQRLVEHLLYLRGIITQQQSEEYLNTPESLYLPPSILTDLEVAITRVKKARDQKEKVCIYGDFDADGITGTALLIKAFLRFGISAIPYIPDRSSEGHGLNFGSLKKIASNGVKLIITVDCGTNDLEEISFAKSMGIDTIVTDHHASGMSESDAIAILNPKSELNSNKFDQLTGVGMALKFADALLSGEFEDWDDGLFELAAIGTITDMAPLVGDNRYIVNKGIQELRSTKNIGLLQLMASAKIDHASVSAENIGFSIGPRINSAGRLGDAIVAFELLTTHSTSKAIELSGQLEKTNLERRVFTEEHIIHCTMLAEKLEDIGNLLIVGDHDLNVGIIGLTAGKLSEKFGVPTAVYSIKDQVVSASCRTNTLFNWADALDTCADLLIRYGGHAQAAGFTCDISNLPELQVRLDAIAAEKFDPRFLISQGIIDAEATPTIVMRDAFPIMKLMEPFGIGNPAPIFLGRNMLVDEVVYMGKDSQHLQLKLRDHASIWTAIAFNQAWVEGTREADFVFSISISNWKGKPRLRLNIHDYFPVPESNLDRGG